MSRCTPSRSGSTRTSYFALARATYREMVAAGYTHVGEFHYLHHRPDGTPLRRRQRDGRGAPGRGRRGRHPDQAARHLLPQQRLRSAARGRAAPLQRRDRAAVGGRVPRPDRRGASTRCGPCRATSSHVFRGRTPLHVHLSEQPRENEECLKAYGVTPTRLLHDEGLLGPGTTVVHATHLTDEDIELLGGSRTNVCITPTTERDLADGIGPARRLHEAGCRVSHRQRQPRGGRPLRGAARPRDGRASGDPRARPLDRRRAARRRHPRPSASARGGSRSAPAPTWSRSTPGPRGRLAPVPTSTPPSSPRPPPTSRT